MAMTFYSLGAAQEVTGSKHILEINGRQITWNLEYKK